MSKNSTRVFCDFSLCTNMCFSLLQIGYPSVQGAWRERAHKSENSAFAGVTWVIYFIVMHGINTGKVRKVMFHLRQHISQNSKRLPSEWSYATLESKQPRGHNLHTPGHVVTASVIKQLHPVTELSGNRILFQYPKTFSSSSQIASRLHFRLILSMTSSNNILRINQYKPEAANTVQSSL